MADVGLAPATTVVGLMELMMLHETKSPFYKDYDKGKSLRAMRLIRRVIENRTRHPESFGRPGVRPGPGAAYAIMTSDVAFGAFSSAPRMPAVFMVNVNKIIRFAGDPTSPWHRGCREHVDLAILAATERTPPTDVARRDLYYWRKDDAGPPSAFTPVYLIETLQGNNYWGQTLRD